MNYDRNDVMSKLQERLQPLVDNRLELFKKKRASLCNRIIYGHAAMAAGFGLIPIVDIAMSIVLTKNMTYLLHAVWSNESIISPQLVGGIISGGTRVASLTNLGFKVIRILKAIETTREVFTAGQLVSKVFESSIVGILIGQAISVGVNGLFIITVGELLYKMLKDSENQETVNFNEST